MELSREEKIDPSAHANLTQGKDYILFYGKSNSYLMNTAEISRREKNGITTIYHI